MARSVTCPGCRHVLHLSDDLAPSAVTCPRCLCEISIPQIGEAITRSAPHAKPNFCPRCGESVQPSWRGCPCCLEPLARRFPCAASVDDDVRRDNKGILIGISILAVLFGIGAIVFVVSGGLSALWEGNPVGAILLIGGLSVFLICVFMVFAIGGAGSTQGKAASGALGGCAIGLASSLTVALVMLVLVVGAIFAVVSSIANSCASCANPNQPPSSRPESKRAN